MKKITMQLFFTILLLPALALANGRGDEFFYSVPADQATSIVNGAVETHLGGIAFEPNQITVIAFDSRGVERGYQSTLLDPQERIYLLPQVEGGSFLIRSTQALSVEPCQQECAELESRQRCWEEATDPIESFSLLRARDQNWDTGPIDGLPPPRIVPREELKNQAERLLNELYYYHEENDDILPDVVVAEAEALGALLFQDSKARRECLD